MADSIADDQLPASRSLAQEQVNTEGMHLLVPHQLNSKAYVLGRLGREVRRRFTQTLAAWSLNPSHYGVLLLLEEIGQASQQQLAKLLDIDRANMVDLLDVLQGREFVERTADARDRRRHIIKLTVSGRQAISQMRQATDKLDYEFFRNLDAQEQATLHTLLLKLFKSELD
ncbi:MarR family transcriptional regulator [Ktedonosporobacter rubrisoli]|uniref:MarR family transcriptional regulator n=1 Tax=Ktedonosporobacter rubrisoli TaxID=2509675 RepID=A0A4P6JJ65_KTERU|nr:MarR family transcriptional regulator [Ktedonosporobacter rubrisoli]QBD75063.1 MarR family transcriptional regulator [Ktedonosporobacter rubrisoli]